MLSIQFFDTYTYNQRYNTLIAPFDQKNGFRTPLRKILGANINWGLGAEFTLYIEETTRTISNKENAANFVILYQEVIWMN